LSFLLSRLCHNYIILKITLKKRIKKCYNTRDNKGDIMAIRKGIDRNMGILFPQYIDDYIPKDHIVRVYDKLIDVFSDDALGLRCNEYQVGNPKYAPRIMLKILIYSYSQGIRSSRKIEKALYDNISFKWLSHDLKPDHKTISEFRRHNEETIKKVLKSVIKLCKKMDLIGGNYLFIDGTKIKGNVSLNGMWTKKRVKRVIENLDKHTKKLLEKHAANDRKEDGLSSFVKVENIKEKLQEIETEKEEILKIEKKIEEKGNNYNPTDEESVLLKTRKGTVMGFNGQIGTDEKHGLIVSSDIIAQNNDFNLFSSQLKQAEENVEEEYEGGVADAGYSSVTDLKELLEAGKDIIVPSQSQRTEEIIKTFKKKEKKFSKDKFRYNEEEDYYICPKGEKLLYISTSYNKKRKENLKYYIIKDKNICFQCPYYRKCTKSKYVRRINRGEKDEIRDKLKKRYLSEEGQEKYRKRKYKVEPVFGHFKMNLGFRDFLLRGIKGARIEFHLVSINYNIIRMINIKGINVLLEGI